VLCSVSMGMGFPDNCPRGLMTPTAITAVGVRSKQPAASGLFHARPLKGARMSFAACVIVMVGGAIGTLARYVVSVLAFPISRELPWGTIIINITGSLIIGFFGTFTLSHGRFPVSENLRLFVMVGFCGGYTTFSAFSLQTLDLLRAGALGRALANIALSVTLCVCAVGIGHLLASYMNGGATQIAQLRIEEEV
jgi:CrcB protein